MKKIISLLIFSTILLYTCIPAFAVEGTSAKVYDFYTDNMLFQQNETATISGLAKSGALIECELYNFRNLIVSKGKTYASKSGTFSVNFDAPNGGFTEYYICLKQNGEVFKTIKGVVFGEQWLASGQSNMQLYMKMIPDWNKFKFMNYGNKWVRILSFPDYPAFEDVSTITPALPQTNIPGAYWARGCDEEISDATAVGYYFAEELVKKLNVPVGILNASLGGSSIETWLSRDVVENDETALNLITKHNRYSSIENWGNVSNSYGGDMCSNYNARVYPLHDFKISGMLWYQGEADITSYLPGEYAHMFNLLQELNTQTFNYSKGKLPVVYTQLATFCYNTQRNLQDFNYEYTNMQKAAPESRSMITLYDLPLTFKSNYATIHPLDKEPIGRRMTKAALGLVYEKYDAYTAASFDSITFDGKDAYIKFTEVGDGLKAKDGQLRGFAVCSDDGVYYRADAEIISKDTVRVTCDNVDNPCSVTYAFSTLNDRANLYSTLNGEYFMAVSTFISDVDYQNKIYCDYGWADCESSKIWHMAHNVNDGRDDMSGYYNAWNSILCSENVDSKSAYKGTAGLNIQSRSKIFALEHKFSTKNKKFVDYVFRNEDTDWTSYGCMSFMVRNNGNDDIIIKAKIKNDGKNYLAAINSQENTLCTIPNDGQWHKVSLNLDSLFTSNGKAVDNSTKLNKVESFKIIFNSFDSASEIDIDEFEFSSQIEENNNIDKISLFDIVIKIVKKLFNFISKG